LIPPAKLRETIEQTANERISICSKCTYNSDTKKKLGYSTIRLDFHCTHCGCTLSAKTRCLSCSCPINLWKAVLDNTQEEQINKELHDEHRESASEDIYNSSSGSVQ
jgi:transcription elongation factor Elf1